MILMDIDAYIFDGEQCIAGEMVELIGRPPIQQESLGPSLRLNQVPTSRTAILFRNPRRPDLLLP